MAKFMLIYRNENEPATRPSPEEMQASLNQWGEWFQKCASAMVDTGDALKSGGRVVKSGGILSDGPFMEVKEVIGGYSIIDVDDYEAAVAVSRECPILKARGTVEIREFAGYK